MVAPLAVAPAVQGAGVVVAASAAAAALVLRAPRPRAVAMLVALGLTPVLLLGAVAGGRAAAALRAHPAALAAAALVALLVLAGLVVLLHRRPAALALLAVGLLPFRIPIDAGGQSANLLVPLYFAIAAGVLVEVARLLRPRGAPQAREEGAVAARAADGAAPAEGRPGAAAASSADRDRRRLGLALLAALVLYGLQSLYSTDLQQALKNVVFFYVPFALLFRLLADVRWTGRLVAASLGVAASLALLFAGVGFWEYAGRHLLLNPKVIASNEFHSYFRVNSLFFDPNIYGRFLALVMVALASLLVWARSRRDLLLATAALAVLWAGLLLTFSQSSFAALLLGLAVVAALRWRILPVIATVAVAGLVALAVVVALPGTFRLDLRSAKSIDRATTGRLDLVRGGLSMFAARPAAGFGSGSFAERFRARERVGSARATSASHTIPITIAAEQGVVGLASYVFVLVAAFALLFRGLGRLAGRDPPDPRLATRAALAAAFTALTFHTFAYAAFLEDPMTWVLLGAAVGCARGVGPASAERTASTPAPTTPSPASTSRAPA